MKFGLGLKIAAFTSALICLIGVALLGVLVYQERVTLHDMKMDEAGSYTKRTSSQVGDALYNLDIRELRRVVRSALEGGVADLVWVLDDKGRLLTDGSEKPLLRNQKPPYPIIEMLISSKVMSNDMDEQHHWTGVPVMIGESTVLGYVVVAFASDHLNARLRENLIKQLFILIPALFFGIVAAFLLGRKIAKPLEAVSAAAEKIGGGDWGVSIGVNSKDEVGDLARTINIMAGNLSKIAVSRDMLEGIVAEKTAELQKLYDHLQQSIEERTRELAQSEERFRGFAESTSDWFWEMDENLRINYLSERYEEVTGRPKAALMGMTRRELADPKSLEADTEKWQQHFNDLDEHRPFRNFEYDILSEFGGGVITFSVSGVPVFDEYGVFKGYRGSGEDASERKIILEELRHSERKFRSIVQTTREGYWLIDPQTKETLEVNSALCEMLGFTEAEMLGKTPLDFVDEDNAKVFASQMAKIPDTDHRSYDIDLKKKDGGDLHTHFEASTIRTPDGTPRASFAFVMDITTGIQAQNELRKARDAADRANQAKSEFLSSMSHELRTPLNGILGFAQLLQYDPSTPLTGKQKDSTDFIIKSGNHLLELIDQVLELAKIEAGKISVSLESLVICEVFEECTPLVQGMADKRGISFVQDKSSCENVRVLADHTRLKQVMLNLLSNAVKYNCENGSITVSGETIENKMMRVTVTDTGLGIPKDKEQNLFQPFERLGHEASEIEGTGIGLTITRELIQLMGGEIGFESELGKGSSFWIDIPLAAENGYAEKEGAQAVSQMGDTLDNPIGDGGRSYLILYVEDNPANLMLMEHVLDMVPNVELISTHTAELGVELAAARHPDLILMDINLPGMNGIEALSWLKKRETTRDIPVIAVTAAAMPHEREKGMEQGFVTYVTKPIQIDTFLQAVRASIQPS